MSAVRDAAEFEDLPADEDGRARRDASVLFDPALAEIGELFRGAETLTSIRTPVRDAQPATTGLAVALAGGAMTIEAGPADWTKTLTLVERAAATIKAYEKRFLQVEKQSKALADRAAEDQHRLHAHIQSLEDRVKQAEERVAAAELAARDAEYHEWEADMRAKRAEQHTLEAEARVRQSETYLRRVHELLSGVS